jgi:hypothetical protein
MWPQRREDPLILAPPAGTVELAASVWAGGGLAAAALGPLREEAEREAVVDFTPLRSGQRAALGRMMPAKTLTVTLASEALDRFSKLRPLEWSPSFTS